MTLPSRHRILNSNPWGLRPCTLPVGQGGSNNIEFYEWMGKKHFCFFQTAETGKRAPNASVKGSGANHYHRAPALSGVSANTRKWSFFGWMLGRRRRRWTSIEPTMAHLVFAGNSTRRWSNADLMLAHRLPLNKWGFKPPLHILG